MTLARAALCAALLAAAPGARAEADLQAGQWHIGVLIEIPGGRGPNPGNLEHELCLTPADAEKLVMPPGSPCRVSDLRESPTEMTWKLECDQGRGVRTSGSGRIEFSGDRFKGSVTTRTVPYDMTITQHMAGRRLGPCKFPQQPPARLPPYRAR